MNKTIIISGNKHYGLGKTLYKTFPNASFYSRSCGGFDFFKDDDVIKFSKLSLDYDVYISCSCLNHFRQTLLLGAVWKVWKDNNKNGQIIAIGSTADWSTKPWLYPTEKVSLRDFCRRFAGMTTGGGPNLFKGIGIRITYLAPGMLDLPRQQEKYGNELAKLDTYYLCDIIKWLIDQPENVNIHNISLDPIQQ